MVCQRSLSLVPNAWEVMLCFLCTLLLLGRSRIDMGDRVHSTVHLTETGLPYGGKFRCSGKLHREDESKNFWIHQPVRRSNGATVFLTLIDAETAAPYRCARPHVALGGRLGEHVIQWRQHDVSLYAWSPRLVWIVRACLHRGELRCSSRLRVLSLGSRRCSPVILAASIHRHDEQQRGVERIFLYIF